MTARLQTCSFAGGHSYFADLLHHHGAVELSAGCRIWFPTTSGLAGVVQSTVGK